jgi:hypothetical protein
MKNKRCSVYQRINGQRTYQWTKEVLPSSDSQYRVLFETPGRKYGFANISATPQQIMVIFRGFCRKKVPEKNLYRDTNFCLGRVKASSSV